MLDRCMTQKRFGNRSAKRGGYKAPSDIRSVLLSELLRETGRPQLESKQLALLTPQRGAVQGDVQLYFSGDLSLLDRPCVAIVGSRGASEDGLRRARRLARELVNSGFVVVSGLALGIDAAAHEAAIEAAGSTIAVIGTPLDKAYPADNKDLQKEIAEHHLVVSPFAIGEPTYKSSFPKRNRVMAAITDATVIIEASETSGTLHQAAECVRQHRWLFFSQSLVENPKVTWPQKFLKESKAAILKSTNDVVDRVLAERS